LAAYYEANLCTLHFSREKQANAIRVCKYFFKCCSTHSYVQDSFIKLIQSGSSSTAKKAPQSLHGGKKKSANAKKSKVVKKKSKANLTEVVGAPVYLN
jgi:hypothetical protein